MPLVGIPAWEVIRSTRWLAGPVVPDINVFFRARFQSKSTFDHQKFDFTSNPPIVGHDGGVGMGGGAQKPIAWDKTWDF